MQDKLIIPVAAEIVVDEDFNILSKKYQHSTNSKPPTAEQLYLFCHYMHLPIDKFLEDIYAEALAKNIQESQIR